MEQVMQPGPPVEPAGDPTSDTALLARAGTDAAAFRAFYDRHAVAVHGWFRRRGTDHHAALDMTAETFAQAWLSRERFEDRRGDGSAAPWLFGIARHVRSHALRHHAVATAARERLGMITPTGAADASTATAIEAVDGMDPRLDDGLAALDGPSRTAVRMRVVDGAGYDEIGRHLGCSALAARIRVSRALGRLRDGMGDGARTEGTQTWNVS